MSTQTWRDSVRFLGSFVRRPRTIGAILPSSRHLACALTGELEMEDGDLVVEFGPGTGPITAVIHRRMPGCARYLGIEQDGEFLRLLRERFPALPFHHGSAHEIERILADRGLPRPRHIISGLPFASLPSDMQNGIIHGVDRTLAPEGEFRTFQYVHAYGLPSARRFRSRMVRHFPTYRRSGPVLRNVPPAYVLSYRR